PTTAIYTFPYTTLFRSPAAPKGSEARAAAARAIDAVLHEGRSLKAVLRVLADVPDVRDRALVEAICFHALRHLRRYRFALKGWRSEEHTSELQSRGHLV